MKQLFFYIIVITLLFVNSSCTEDKHWPISSSLFDVQYVAHARYYSDSLVENSLPLFEFLVGKGYRIVECDVLFTKDDVPVLMHTTNVKELASLEGSPYNQEQIEVDSLCFEDLLKYDFSNGGGGIFKK